MENGWAANVKTIVVANQSSRVVYDRAVYVKKLANTGNDSVTTSNLHH